MFVLDQEKFLVFLRNNSIFPIVLVSTPVCSKCKTLIDAIENDNNIYGIVQYKFVPNDVEAATELQNIGVNSVPFIIARKGPEDYQYLNLSSDPSVELLYKWIKNGFKE